MSGTAVWDEALLRQAFGRFPSGVAALCAVVGDTPIGMAVSSFTTASLRPPLVSAFVQNVSATWPKLRTVPRLGISVLSEHQERAGRSLAMKAGNRFEAVRWRANERGAIFVEEAAAWFDCSVHREVPAGDHALVLLEIHDLGIGNRSPLVFHGSNFRRLQVEDESDRPGRERGHR